MKNVREYQLKKCIFMETEEFDRVIKTIFGNNYEANFSLDGMDVYSNEDGLSCEEINEGLSKYFEVEVTSTHIDDCDCIGVWICYKEIDEEYKKKCEKLKRKCFDLGADAMEDLLGVSLEFETDKAMFEFADDILAQMPDEEFEMLYDRYCGGN